MRDEENRRFTGTCDGSKSCKCRKCCGDRVVVSIQKNVLGYDRRCLKWCRPGTTTAGTVEIQGTVGPGEREIVASDLVDVSCTNSLIHADINAEYEIDMRCAARTITRDVLILDDAIPTPGLWQKYSLPLLCDGTATVEIDADVEITTSSDLVDTTINAEFIDILTSINEGAVPLVVSNNPTLPSTITVEVDVSVEITPP